MCLQRRELKAPEANNQRIIVTNRNLKISKGLFNMPDKDPKNIEKLKDQAEEKHEEILEWKHETPAEKQEIHEQEEAEKQPEAETPQ